jgi:predicted TPR repeat methyltransferase
LKDLSVGKEAFNAAMALNPTTAALWFGLAMLHSLEGRKAEALEALKKSISLDPKLTGTAMVEPAFESIRGERRFQSLIRPGGQTGK